MPGTLKLNSGGAGNLILTPSGSVGSDVTVTLPAATATLLTNKTAGTVLQVVNATYGTYTITTSSSYVDTGLTASITPTSASSKILCLVNLGGVSRAVANGSVGFQLVRNSTSIIEFERFAGYNAGGSGENGVGSCSTSYLDSPATTSSTTYKVQFVAIGASSSARINNYFSSYAGISTITLLEIAA